jgi:hypothetical protein
MDTGEKQSMSLLVPRCPTCYSVLEQRVSVEGWQKHFACWFCEVIWCADGLVLVECARPLEHVAALPLWAKRRYGRERPPDSRDKETVKGFA